MKMWPSKRKKKSQEQVLLHHGVRSGLEEKVCKELSDMGVEYEYETRKIKYVIPEKTHTYTPDIWLPNGIVIELKGRWTAEDRQKIALVKSQHPELDLRMVFSNSRAKISKVSKTTYGDYCNKLGIPFADKHIPIEWIEE
jgi:hypothetical protein